jgi:rhomboid protease GluP
VTPLFVRRESFQQFIRFYPIITFILGINTLLFLFSFLLPTLYREVVEWWGVGWNAAVAAGQYWRLVTPIFLHGGFGHFFLNSFALIIFGPALETILGRMKFLGLYMFAGILGNVGTFLFEVGDYYHVGASGAIYGLLGLYLYMRFFRQDLIDAGSAQIVTVILIIGAVHTLLLPQFTLFGSSGINVLGHLFGFIGGVILGPVIFLGRVKYFSMVNTPGYRSRALGDDDIGFDPNRWHKKRKRKKIIKFAVLGLFILFVIFGLLSRFF